jgi:hypothetical protein
MSGTEDLRHKVSIPQAIRFGRRRPWRIEERPFTEALIRIREGEGLYQHQRGHHRRGLNRHLFQTAIAMPGEPDRKATIDAHLPDPRRRGGRSASDPDRRAQGGAGAVDLSQPRPI